MVLRIVGYCEISKFEQNRLFRGKILPVIRGSFVQADVQNME